MLNMCVKRVARVIICCLLMSNVRGQPFYYDEERTYYHDSGSANEMYNLDPVEHNHDGSMRALAGARTDVDATTINYYDEFQNIATDLTSFAPSQQRSVETTTNRGDDFRQMEETTTVGNKNTNSQTEDSSNIALDTTKQSDITSPSSQFQEIKPTLPHSVTNSTQFNLLEQFNKTEKLLNNENQNKSAVTKHNGDFSGYSSDISKTDLNVVSTDAALKNNVVSQQNLSSTFDQQTNLENASMRDVITNTSGMCDAKTHYGCDVIHYERCDPETKQCRCLNGFFPENGVLGTGHCRAVSFYHGHLKVTAPKSSQKFSHEQMMAIKQKLMFLIGLSLKRWGLDLVLDLNIHSVDVKDHQTSLTFEVRLNKDILSRDDDAQLALSRDVIEPSLRELLMDASELFPNGGNGSSSSFSPLVEVNPCISSDHNHCSQHSSCSYADGSVSCQCRQGYEDLTPNLYRLPGEVCIEKCECHNGGICVDVDVPSLTRQCSCLKWYFGAGCQINGKELLLICCCSIGSVLLLCVATCCCYYGCAKHRDNMARSSMFSLSPDINILKLPRVWMDTSGYNDNDLSPNNHRRLSVTSERNPYFNGYIMGDVSLGTLQHDRDNHSYYQVSQTSLGHCPATMSSHSFYRY